MKPGELKLYALSATNAGVALVYVAAAIMQAKEGRLDSTIFYILDSVLGSASAYNIFSLGKKLRAPDAGNYDDYGQKKEESGPSEI